MSQQPKPKPSAEAKNNDTSKDDTLKTHKIRILEKSDFSKGFLDLLSQLTSTGNVTKEAFEKAFDNLSPQKTVFVIEDKDEKGNTIIIGSISIIMEQKFIHSCRCVAHIEDVVIHKNFRKKGLGKALIDHGVKFAEQNNAYKCILDCSKKNIGFYNKCGFIEKEIEMAYYFGK